MHVHVLVTIISKNKGFFYSCLRIFQIFMYWLVILRGPGNDLASSAATVAQLIHSGD